jgi:alpha-1,3-fucosyltransferase
MSPHCYEMISKKYYFYLSFENSICKDYVTEKFFNVLSRPILPVVYGGANYTYFLPAKGYVNALSFESPKALAKQLLQIASDSDVYNSYFEWKRHFELTPTHSWPCELCSVLHQPLTNQTRWSHLHRFWHEEAKCIYPHYSF